MKKRTDITNTALITDGGTVSSIYLRCPHCGLIDYQYSAQGIKESLFQITRVGAVRKYECGKCRKHFRTIELCIPAGEDTLAYYEQHIATITKENAVP